MRVVSKTYEVRDALKYFDTTFTSSQTLTVPNIPQNFKAIFTVHRNAHNQANTAWLEVGSDTNNCLLFWLTGSGYQGALGSMGVFANVKGSYADYQSVECVVDDSVWEMEYTYNNGVYTITDGTNSSTITDSQITSRTYVKVNVNRSTLRNLIIMPL